MLTRGRTVSESVGVPLSFLFLCSQRGALANPGPPMGGGLPPLFLSEKARAPAVFFVTPGPPAPHTRAPPAPPPLSSGAFDSHGPTWHWTAVGGGPQPPPAAAGARGTARLKRLPRFSVPRSGGPPPTPSHAAAHAPQLMPPPPHHDTIDLGISRWTQIWGGYQAWLAAARARPFFHYLSPALFFFLSFFIIGV